jgi:zinc transporter ZupT
VSGERATLWGWGALPLVLLAAAALLLARTDLLDFLRRGAPPVEELTFDRVELEPHVVRVDVVNGGPDPVTVAQVMVDEAFWAFTIEPGPTIERLGRATITLPYPWVQHEAHEITLLTSTGLTFAHEIAVATATPRPDAGFFGVFALIGLYVGVIPVAIGLLWYPLLRRVRRHWIDFALAVTIGLLVFLGVDTLAEALETASGLAGAFQGALLVTVAALGTVLGLQMVAGSRVAASGPGSRMAVAVMVALGIGLHNLGEGLAIGAAYALGEASLGAFLVIGFMLHNTTEGLGIVAPIARDAPRLRALAGLGMLAGVPTIVGAWLGGLAYSPLFATLFLSLGAGAIAQVVLVLVRAVRAEGPATALSPLNAAGMLAGLLVMYGTGLLVA